MISTYIGSPRTPSKYRKSPCSCLLVQNLLALFAGNKTEFWLHIQSNIKQTEDLFPWNHKTDLRFVWYL